MSARYRTFVFGAQTAAARVLGRDLRSFLYDMLPANSIGAEVGVWRGDFSAALLREARPARLHFVDPWMFVDNPAYKRAWYGGSEATSQEDMDEIYLQVIRRFSLEIAEKRVLVHRGRSTDVAAEFTDGALDWVYVDADHTYQASMSDLSAWWGKIKSGGLLAGDDYGNPGWWDDGVTRAVDHFVQEHDLTPDALKHGQFVLRRT